MSYQDQEIRQKIDFFNQILNKESHLNCIVHNLSEDASQYLNSFNSSQKKGILYGKTIAVKNKNDVLIDFPSWSL